MGSILWWYKWNPYKKHASMGPLDVADTEWVYVWRRDGGDGVPMLRKFYEVAWGPIPKFPSAEIVRYAKIQGGKNG